MKSTSGKSEVQLKPILAFPRTKGSPQISRPSDPYCINSHYTNQPECPVTTEAARVLADAAHEGEGVASLAVGQLGRGRAQ